jgi:hypothetical protein
MSIKKIYKEVEEEKENEVEDDSITMDKEEYLSEHRNLIKVLRSGDKKLQEAEAKKQEEEIAEYDDEDDDEDED